MKFLKAFFIFNFVFVYLTFPALSAATFEEDCISFDPKNIKIKRFEGRKKTTWKIVSKSKGSKTYSNWMTDHPNREEAEKALQIILKYKFTNHCFVGRPKPSMKYWK